MGLFGGNGKKKRAQSNKEYAEDQAYVAKSLQDKYNLSGLEDDISSWFNTYNPNSKYYFRSNNQEDILNRYSDYLKEQMNDRVNNYLKDNYGYDWQSNYWNDDLTNQYANNFVNTKYNDVLQQLENAYKRGTLNEVGYNNALNNLSNQKGTALSQVKSIGQGITDNYKSDLGDVYTNYMSYFDSDDLNDYNFDMGGLDTAIQNKYNTQLENYGTDFDAQTSSLNPFDFSSILGTARAGMGDYATNTPQQQAVQGEAQENKNKKVGLGNTGLF